MLADAHIVCVWGVWGEACETALAGAGRCASGANNRQEFLSVTTSLIFFSNGE